MGTTQFDSLTKMVADMQTDFDKFYNKGQKAAGTRIRKHMQDLKQKANDIRKDVQEIKNAAKTP